MMAQWQSRNIVAFYNIKIVVFDLILIVHAQWDRTYKITCDIKFN
jgi:hypothetical protein